MNKNLTVFKFTNLFQNMKLFSLLLVALFAFANAHFDVEKYAQVYRDKRAEYIEAKKELIISEGAYVSARNAYIAATATLSNAEIPEDDADPRMASELSTGDAETTDVEVENGYRRLRNAPKKLKTEGDHHEYNFTDDPANPEDAPDVVTQMETYEADYLAARADWLQKKHRLAILEGPYLAAREAYLVAANSYTNTLVAYNQPGHLWEPVFVKDKWAEQVLINGGPTANHH